MVEFVFGDERLPRRFWDKVQLSTTGCWLWVAGTAQGYGVYSTGRALHDGRSLKTNAHRLSYEALVGPIPDGLQIDHLCRVRICINPAHLEPVTLAENLRRAAAAKKSCPHGHAYTEENTTVRNGKRECRECNRIRWRAKYYRNKAAIDAALNATSGGEGWMAGGSDADYGEDDDIGTPDCTATEHQPHCRHYEPTSGGEGGTDVR